MSNEEIAAAIQNGHTELLSELWDNTYKLLRMLITRQYKSYAQRLKPAGSELDDFLQEGYFALKDAVKAYKPDNGVMFNSYLNYSVKNRMRSLMGCKIDASLHSISLGEPITGSDKNEPLTLGDTLPDPDSEAEIIGIIEGEYQKQLHAVLDDCLNRLNPAEKEAITDHFYRNVSFKAMAEKNGTTAQEELNRFNKGLRKLQHGRTLQTLKAYL